MLCGRNASWSASINCVANLIDFFRDLFDRNVGKVVRLVFHIDDGLGWVGVVWLEAVDVRNDHADVLAAFSIVQRYHD